MVGRRDSYLGMGLDCEHVFDSRQCSRLESRILSPSETSRIKTMPQDRNLLLSLVYSAKESLFKAGHVNTKWLDFHACELIWLDSGKMMFTKRDTQPATMAPIRVSYWLGQDYVLTSCVIRARHAPAGSSCAHRIKTACA